MKKLFVAALAALPLLALAAGPRLFAEGFGGPENEAFDGQGGLYVSDTNHLWRMEGNKPVPVYARAADESTSLGGVALGPEGKIYFSVGTGIKTYDPAGGAVAPFVSGFKFANGICFDDAGDLFIADSNARALYVVPAGTREVRPLQAKAGWANGVAWNREQNALYYTLSFPGELRVMTLGPGPSDAGERSLRKFPGAFLDDLTLDAAGNAYVCQWGGGRVVKVDRSGRQEDALTGLEGPSSVEFAPGTSTLYVTVKGKTFAFKGTSMVTVDLKPATGQRQPFQP